MKKEKQLLLLIIILAVILRFFSFDISPPGFYSDEANQGYNAYSLLTTGRDEHRQLLPVSLRSFGDWKPPMQTYLAIPMIAVLGRSAYAVRLPSMVLGVLSVFVTFYLVKRLNLLPKVALLSALFLAISPWHLHQSRSAMLVMVALFFFQTGVLLFLDRLKHARYLVASALCFAGAIYAYYGMRLIVPLFIAFLLARERHQLTQLKRRLGLFFFILLFSLFPLFAAFVHQPDVVFGRAKTVSVFHDRGIELRIWELTAQEGQGKVAVARFFHNKPYFYSIDITRRFFSHLGGQFLFLTGDTAPPFQIPNMGVLYLSDGVLFIPGIYLLLKKRRRQAIFFLLFLGLALLPAALTFMTPSANRTFNAVLPFTLFAAYGIIVLRKKMETNIGIVPLALIVASLYTWQFSLYLKHYYQVLPDAHAHQWNYGYKELVQFVQTREDNYDRIVVLPRSNIAYTYFLFYAKGNPLTLASTMERDYTPDEFGFEHVNQMGKYVFLRKGTLAHARRNYHGRTLFIGTGEEINDGTVVSRISYTDGRDAFLFVE